MIYIVKIDDKEYEVEVERGQANIIKTTTAAEPSAAVPAAVPVPAPAAVPASSVPSASVKGEVIKAPMPGTIIDIKVSAGTNVKKGDIILVLEAMKMENELAAPVDGVVDQVFVSKGSSVATDDMLISIQ